MTKNIDSILKEVLGKIKPSKKEIEKVNNFLKEFTERLKKKFKTLKIDAEIFVGGSFAKNTMIKKDNYDTQNQRFSVSQSSNKIQEPYDIDIFVKFPKNKNNKEMSNLLYKALRGFKNVSLIHGSRDYFRIRISKNFFIELIPVIKVKNPKEARNVTDLSYSHVSYIKRKIKSEKILDEIRLLKAFCFANGCYGAESYINGFSGYGLELLIYNYGSFLRFIKAMTKVKDKVIIDIEEHYKDKKSILMDLNSSKLKSPIILIDPTYKQRNALSALSEETFGKFKNICKKFLKNPSINSFELKEIDFKKSRKEAKKKGFEFILLKADTDKQEGDIAGSKLLKFYKHLSYEIGKFFYIKSRGFEYDKGKSARFFFSVKKKNEILIQGPNKKDKNNVNKFKKKHKNMSIKNGKIYAKEKVNFNIKEFIKNWKKKNKEKIKDMSIEELRIIK